MLSCCRSFLGQVVAQDTRESSETIQVQYHATNVRSVAPTVSEQCRACRGAFPSRLFEPPNILTCPYDRSEEADPPDHLS